MSRARLPLAVLALCLAGRDARAEEAMIEYRGVVDSFLAGRSLRVADSAVNPGNAVLAIPQLGAIAELRPQLRLEASRLQMIVRPRVSSSASAARIGGEWQDTVASAGSEWTELYGAWTVSDSLTIAYGLQNFQWGPAELLGPSNRIFHEVGLNRDPLYLVKGKHLLRMNGSAGRNLSAVVLVETRSNGDPPFVAGAEFEPIGLIKLEVASESGAHYAGLVVGSPASLRSWVGEYGQLSISDGITVYADLSHMVGNDVWYPGGEGFAHSRQDAGKVYTLGVVGFRYTFPGGSDARFEFMFNNAGWDVGQLDRATGIVADGVAAAPALLGPYLSPGLELPGQAYLYGSVRVPDLLHKQLVLTGRYLFSPPDRSGRAYLGADWSSPGGSWVVSAAAIAAHGEPDRELTRFADQGFTLVSKYSW